MDSSMFEIQLSTSSSQLLSASILLQLGCLTADVVYSNSEMYKQLCWALCDCRCAEAVGFEPELSSS